MLAPRAGPDEQGSLEGWKMTATAPTPEEIRKARAYLQNAGIRTSDISPRRFVTAAKEMGKGFRQTLKHLVLLLSGGQGLGPSKIATANKNRLDPQEALGDMTPSQRLGYDNVEAPRD